MSVRKLDLITIRSLIVMILAVALFACSDRSTEPENVGVTITVPGDYGTIQEAINAAKDWDAILISDGIYHERINFLGNRLMVVSKYYLDLDPSHIENTIIDGSTYVLGSSDTGSVVVFVNGEDQNAVLIGLTIRKGSGTIVGDKSGSIRCGGGIYCDRTSPTITHCLIENNYAEKGGGFYGHNSTVLFEACTFQSNHGAALYAEGDSSKLEIFKSEILRNSRHNSSDAAGIHVNSGTLDVDDCSIGRHNGTGIIVMSGAQASVKSSDLFENSHEAGGGALHAEDAQVAVSNCTFMSNSSLSGSAILSFESQASVTGCEFIGNIATWGIIVSESSILNVDDCVIEQNLSNGGTIFAYSSVLALSDCLLARNGDGQSAVLTRGGTTFTATQCTFFRNGGSYASVDDSENPITFVNCIIAHNYEPIETGTFSCCNIYGNTGGDWVGDIADQLGVNGNMSLDPMFCDTLGGDFHPNPNSPCAPSNNECGTQIGAFGVDCQ